jgi:hypothetical protein
VAGDEGADLLDACCVLGGSSLFAIERGKVEGKGVAGPVPSGRVRPAVRVSHGNGLLTPVDIGGNEAIDGLFVPGLGATVPVEPPRRRVGEIVQHQMFARVEREAPLSTRRGSADAGGTPVRDSCPGERAWRLSRRASAATTLRYR